MVLMSDSTWAVRGIVTDIDGLISASVRGCRSLQRITRSWLLNGPTTATSRPRTLRTRPSPWGDGFVLSAFLELCRHRSCTLQEQTCQAWNKGSRT